MSHFRETINNNKNSIICLRLRKVNNEIHGDILLRFFRRLKMHDGSKWKVMSWFCNLTLRAGLGEFKNIAFEMISGEVSLNV